MSLCFRWCPLSLWSSCNPSSLWLFAIHSAEWFHSPAVHPHHISNLVELNCHEPSLLGFSEEVERFPQGLLETSRRCLHLLPMAHDRASRYPLPPVLLNGFYKVTLTSKVIMEEGKQFSFVSGLSSGNLSLLFLNVDFLFFFWIASYQESS